MNMIRDSLRKYAPALLAWAIGLPCASTSFAQTYPARPVRIVVPFAPGGPTDALARLLAQQLAERLGKTFIIDNRPGAGGNIGIGIVAKATPDGHTILMASSSFVVNPSLYAAPGYDPFKDFAPVTNAGNSPSMLIVHPSVPAKTVRELIALIKANPGKYSSATPGIGTTGGQTPITFTAGPLAIEHIKTGGLRALAVTSRRRLSVLPGIPTLAEAGVPDLVSELMHGVLLPAGTAKEIVQILYREIARIVALPEIKRPFAALGYEPLANNPAEFAAQLRVEVEKWGKVVRGAKLKVD
ncbi:MAG: tripartite tricarboxylate transporter substrate binding protein [Betaproteobacteria bacterium]|nr:tripartite tricarboxylate transporter substrate binding protein [Betaproteobacteria bacterium]